jgi:hypothetical protein
MSHKLKNPRPQGRRATFKPNAAGRVSQQRLREQLAADWPKISSARKLTTTQRRVNLIFPVFYFLERPNYKKARRNHRRKINCPRIRAIGNDSIGNLKREKKGNHKNNDSALNDLKYFPSRNSAPDKK